MGWVRRQGTRAAAAIEQPAWLCLTVAFCWLVIGAPVLMLDGHAYAGATCWAVAAGVVLYGRQSSRTGGNDELAKLTAAVEQLAKERRG